MKWTLSTPADRLDQERSESTASRAVMPNGPPKDPGRGVALVRHVDAHADAPLQLRREEAVHGARG